MNEAVLCVKHDLQTLIVISTDEEEDGDIMYVSISMANSKRSDGILFG